MVILFMSHRQPLLHELFAALGIDANAHWVAGWGSVVTENLPHLVKQSDSRISGVTLCVSISVASRFVGAQFEKLQTKYFHLQALDLQKAAQKILRFEASDVPLPERWRS